MADRPIRFLRKGRLVEITDQKPRATLLDWLRLEERSCGTKEGCNEGDCGACTVVLSRERDGTIVYEPVNACILLLGQADGTEVITVEDLAEDGQLHPVQQAMVDHHASQCGFCTPGIVMSLFALFHGGGTVDRARANDALAGNLCRCTGYRPIVTAAIESCAGPREDRFTETESVTGNILRSLNDDTNVFVGDATSFFAAPASESVLSLILTSAPDVTIVSGATDVGLWITKGLADLQRIVWLGRVKGLDAIEITHDAIVFGATVTHARAMPVLAELDPDLGELMRRFGSEQVRMSGTIGGNIANGSPIGDLPPALIALGATVELRKGDVSRTLPLEAFFLDYKKQNRAPGEYVRRITVPRLGPGERFRAFKISKRRDEDISSVLCAVKVSLQDNIIVSARIAFGGMAGIPKRAATAEAALIGQPIYQAATWRAAAALLTDDFKPMSDHRASAGYRMQVAQATLIKALAEIAGLPTSSTRIAGQREAAFGAA
jgi:xanthine dehydrogenase small subunit